jgi:D-proline reductase (dithiol) PrdB
MCNQSVGLIQAVIEDHGIPTVSISLLKEVTRKVKPPRSLFVDRPLGYPLGTPHDPDLQRRILEYALALLSRPVEEPLLDDYPWS